MDAQISLRFDGSTIEPERDNSRLGDQLRKVLNLMRDGEWRTLDEISRATGSPVASVSARLRDLRKERFGKHVIEREYVDRGLFKYRMAA